MSQKIKEESMDMEVRQTIAAHYGRGASKQIQMIVNPFKRRIRFDVFDDYRFIGDHKPVYSGQSLKFAIKKYNEVGND